MHLRCRSIIQSLNYHVKVIPQHSHFNVRTFWINVSCPSRGYLTIPHSTIGGLRTSKNSCAAIAFDIDGVIIRGNDILPGSQKALSRITPVQYNGTAELIFPYCFLTNSGGMCEHTKAKQISSWIDLDIKSEQICLSHTPMKELVNEFSNKHVLVCGMYDVKNVAKEYGFQYVDTPAELASRHPQLVPHCTEQMLPTGSSIQSLHSNNPVNIQELQRIDAIFIMHDPIDWLRDIQTCLDVLLSRSKENRAKVYFSNPDLLFSGKHYQPRLAQGAFRVALENLYKQITGEEMKYVLYGKPTTNQFRYAEQLLAQRAKQLGFDNIHTIYMIGDNPAADIRGANLAGEPWRSILVETGSIPKSQHPDDQPHFIVKDVLRAIELIEKEEKMAELESIS